MTDKFIIYSLDSFIQIKNSFKKHYQKNVKTFKIALNVFGLNNIRVNFKIKNKVYTNCIA